jgi:predicted ATP-grasp superfamily ATP-dependent carboligase
MKHHWGDDRMESSTDKDHFSVLIPDGESDFALSVLRCLSQITGLSLYVLSNDPCARIRFSRHVTQFFSQGRGEDDEERLAAIRHVVKQTRADVILPVDQRTIRLLSVQGGTMSQLTAVAPISVTEAFDIAANKWLLAEFLKKSAIPCPPTILYQADQGFDQRLSTIPFPVLIKPVHGKAGQGIKLFDNPSELLKFSKEHICSEKFIVQPFIRGYDIDCSVLCQEGKILAYTIQKGFIEGPRPFSPPGGIEFLYDDGTYDIVSSLITALKWTGIANIDLLYDEQDKQVKVIEINPRFWGSLLGSLTAGVNFPYLACLAGLKANLPKVEYQPCRFVKRNAAIKILTQRFLGKNTDLDFDSTGIGFTLRDPFPEVLGSCFRVYRKMMHRGRI